jgi:prepilin-type N-terminal cleavage/methylation domain-containing protein
MCKKKIQAIAVRDQGFSLLELLIAMTVTLAVMAAATTLLATSLRTRTRENARSNALASAQRALNIMTREIGNSGYGLTDNGVVALDSDEDSIRVRSNLNGDTDIGDTDEDVRFTFQTDAIVRYENGGTAGVLASNITALDIDYFDVAGNPTTPAAAERVTIDISVDLPEGPEQPPSVVRLVSDVALRNAPTTLDQF